MKKMLLTALAVTAVATTSVVAQNAVFINPKANNNVDGYSLPRTVVSVTVTQEREVVLRGPYARYASQYLGIIGAPQTDKEMYKILGASVSYFQEPDPNQTYVVDEKATVPTRVFQWLGVDVPVVEDAPRDTDFAGASIVNNNPFKDMGATILTNTAEALQIDRSSTSAKSPEQMAAEAAATIFKLRKKRLELICAEQGENVFGAGLKAALDEIARLEQEYLELFVGKRYTQVTSQTYYVTPEKGKNRMVACRFSDAKGLSDATDLAASPVNIEIVVPAAAAADPNAKKPSVRTVPVLVPQVAIVKVSFNEQILDNERVPLYQFGSLVSAPVI